MTLGDITKEVRVIEENIWRPRSGNTPLLRGWGDRKETDKRVTRKEGGEIEECVVPEVN